MQYLKGVLATAGWKEARRHGRGWDLICDHLGLALLALVGGDDDWVAWQLGGEGDPLPVGTTVFCVQQNGGPAHNPALRAVEANGVESVVEALILGCLNAPGLPRPPAILGF